MTPEISILPPPLSLARIARLDKASLAAFSVAEFNR